jgi:hypothetical protein
VRIFRVNLGVRRKAEGGRQEEEGRRRKAEGLRSPIEMCEV